MLSDAGMLADFTQQSRSDPAPVSPPTCRASTVPLLGSLTEEATGAPLVLPLTEQPALLAFLLALKGSRPSLRQRLFTFQGDSVPFTSPADAPAVAAVGASGAAAAGAAGVATPEQQQEGRVPLASSVFEEAPNPQLLTDGSATVAVLLPSELGLPTDAFAGLDALQVCGKNGRQYLSAWLHACACLEMLRHCW